MSDYIPLQLCTKILKKRLVNNYDSDELLLLRCQKQIILKQIEEKQIKTSKKDAACPIYENQKLCAKKVVTTFRDKEKILVLVYGKTQSGKTGCMVSIIQEYLNDSDNFIDKEHIYIITGLSSKDWTDQTKKRIPGELHDRVFHLPQLKGKKEPKTNKEEKERFASDIKGKKNVLIIMDEVQRACEKGQSVYDAFKQAGLYDIQNLFERDVKIIEFSATPAGTIYDAMAWGNNSEKIQMKPGKGYIGAKDLLKQRRVLQFEDLWCCKKNKNDEFICDEKQLEKNMKDVIALFEFYKRDPRFHIFRTQVASKQEIQLDNIKKILKKHGIEIECKFYDGTSNRKKQQNSDKYISQLNSYLDTKPTINTIICIKEKLRCANTINKKNLGILYERWVKKVQDDVIIQGILGRATGYKKDFDGYVFTNIDTITRFEERFDSDFEDRSIQWLTKTTGKNGKRKSTFNGPEHIAGMKVPVVEQFVPKKKRKVIMRCFNKEELAREYTKNKLGSKKGICDQSIYLNKNGFYMSTVGEIRDKVWSWKDMKEAAKHRTQINKSTGYICRRSYVDINDKDSILFTICHY